MPDQFVPADFSVPNEYAWDRFHLEPLGPQHNERDHRAWMSSIDHIRSTPGFSVDDEPDWPVEMSLESNRDDLVRHERDFEARTGFTYSILDGDQVIGCIYIYPDRRPEHDAGISSWVTAGHAEFDDSIRETLAAWIADEWPFSTPHYAGSSRLG